MESDDESINQESEDVHLAPLKENISENTHVLVKYETGKQNVYYAGCVLKCDEDSVRVNFLRKVVVHVSIQRQRMSMMLATNL